MSMRSSPQINFPPLYRLRTSGCRMENHDFSNSTLLMSTLIYFAGGFSTSPSSVRLFRLRLLLLSRLLARPSSSSLFTLFTISASSIQIPCYVIYLNSSILHIPQVRR